jgi:predicted amidohydrolase YtcJ
VEVIAAADVPRFAALGVVASMMPPHAEPGDEPQGGVWASKVGPERLERAFAFGDLARAGARLAFGSDWPVASIEPLFGIAVAVTRQGADGQPPGGWIPGQRLTVAQVLAGYTSGAAWALRLEDETGVLRPGLAADLVVLGGGADLARPETLFRATVDLTIAGGRVVWDRAAAR